MKECFFFLGDDPSELAMLPDTDPLDLWKENFRGVVGGEPPLVRGKDDSLFGGGVLGAALSAGVLSTAVVAVVVVVLVGSGLWITSEGCAAVECLGCSSCFGGTTSEGWAAVE